ncbi:MAG: hypothetical protein AAGF81_06065 [Pseudomonadota bacterium]
MDDKPGARWSGLQSSYVSDEHHHSVNQQSLHILQIIAELHACYPSEADVGVLHRKLEPGSDSMWRWIVSLGLIEGEPEQAALTIAGKEVLDQASRKLAFRVALEASPQADGAEDRHAAAILALLQANFEFGLQSET